jgi:4-hydroxy-tetrahydrodipicolinate synthase
MTNPFRGCGTALITPFAADGSVDEAAFRRLLELQLEQGIDFLVPCGTTGETPTLERAEHLRLIELAVEAARQARGTAPNNARRPVLGGAGGNNTAHVIALARELESRGVDGILTVAPYYNKPTQEGLYQHFGAIAAAVKVPVVLYNVPGRTASNIEPPTVLRLAQIANIVAVKEASGSLAQIGAILAAAPEGFDVLSGDDALTLAILALGGQGLISVASNPAPAPIAALVAAARSGDFAKARELHFRYLPLMEALFVESSPAPAKCLMAQMGLCEEILRLPLVPVRPSTRDRLDALRRDLSL